MGMENGKEKVEMNIIFIFKNNLQICLNPEERGGFFI